MGNNKILLAHATHTETIVTAEVDPAEIVGIEVQAEPETRIDRILRTRPIETVRPETVQRRTIAVTSRRHKNLIAVSL